MTEMQNIRFKTIAAIVLVFLAVSLSFLYLFIKQQEENQQLLIDSKKQMVSVLMSTLTSQIDQFYSARFQNLNHIHEGVISAFAARDREQLYQNALSVFKVLQQENRYFEHLTFSLPDSTVFLRVQDQESHDEAEEFCKVGTGIEREQEGSRSGFVYAGCGLLYRIAEPIHVQGRFIGTILFDIRIRSYFEDISKSLNIHTALALHTDIVGGTPNGAEYRIRSGDYYLYPYGDPFFVETGTKIIVSSEEQKVQHQGRIHLVFPSFDVKDEDGHKLGSILQAVEITSIAATTKRGLFRLALITAGVLAAASLILFKAFSIPNRQLMELNKTLNLKNEELNRVSHRLEEEVAVRTTELAAANARLQREIDLRHEVNLALARSVEEWQTTFDAISDPVTILDNNLEVVVANKAALVLLGVPQREVVGRKCHELFAGSPTRCASCPSNEVFSKGSQQVYEVEHQHLDKSLMVSCSAIYDGQKIRGYVHTTKDITQEKALKKQLAQAQKMEAIATLAGGIAHDFNNILGAILGNADLLLFRLTAKLSDGDTRRPALSYEDIESHIQAIKKAGNRAKDLVSQILAFSRQGKTQRQNAVITPVIKEAVKLLRSSLPANIEIKIELAEDPGQIYCDLSQIHQVFMNLCTNAAQAMAEKGGVLTVTLKNFNAGAEERRHYLDRMDGGYFEAGREERRRYPDLKAGNYVVLTVADTGHGMSSEVMERIFDPFFTTRDVGVGTGMGLAVIHGIIASHDGILDVKSEVNVGSTFNVFFPCIKTDIETNRDVILGMPRGNEKILFVDDEEDIVRMSSRMLEYLGYTVYPATSGDQALALLRQENFSVDLLITDYSMPGISGLQLASSVARLQPSLPVMLCSGFNESSVLDEGARKHIRKFMSKPLDMKKLAVAIREILPVKAGE
ncbi:MAG TPA: hypothetical protein DDY20_03640 [Desulfobulbaceae bacterium]|nr:hypothetical protein [Desulfobulbaceae bacterium]